MDLRELTEDKKIAAHKGVFVVCIRWLALLELITSMRLWWAGYTGIARARKQKVLQNFDWKLHGKRQSGRPKCRWVLEQTMGRHIDKLWTGFDWFRTDRLLFNQNILSFTLLSKNVISPVVLYECETSSFTLRAEHRLDVFEKGVLIIFGPKRGSNKRLEKTKWFKVNEVYTVKLVQYKWHISNFNKLCQIIQNMNVKVQLGPQVKISIKCISENESSTYPHLAYYSCNIRFNIILPPTPRSPKCSITFTLYE